jgi:hypothetical protein
MWRATQGPALSSITAGLSSAKSIFLVPLSQDGVTFRQHSSTGVCDIQATRLIPSASHYSVSDNMKSLSTGKYRSTVARFSFRHRMRAPEQCKSMCNDLKALKRDASRVLREVKKIRRSRDVSFFEDAALNQAKHDCLHLVLKHLLVGHNGQPCPAGPRPVVNPAARARWRLARHRSQWPIEQFREHVATAMSWVVDVIGVPPVSIVKPSQSAELSAAATLPTPTLMDTTGVQSLRL